jgi:hypothetical protein
MSAVADVLTPTRHQIRHGGHDWVEDLKMLRLGVLDHKSFRMGWKPLVNPVEIRTTRLVDNDEPVNPVLLVTDPNAFTQPVMRKDGVWGDGAFGGKRRYYREIRRQHNTQLTIGKNQVQRIQSFGDVGTGLNSSFIAYTGTTATTLTGASGQPTGTSSAGNAGLQGKIIYVQNSTVANSVFGVCVTNSASVVTVDQWYAIPVTGAAGTTPTSAAGTAWCLPGGSWAWWIGLSTSVAAAAAGDVTRTADGLWADGTATGTATESTASGLTRAYCGQGSGTAPTTITTGIQFNKTWTYGTTGSVTIGKVVLFNSLAVAGTLPLFESLLSATATVAANGDTIVLAGWAITC